MGGWDSRYVSYRAEMSQFYIGLKKLFMLWILLMLISNLNYAFVYTSKKEKATPNFNILKYFTYSRF